MKKIMKMTNNKGIFMLNKTGILKPNTEFIWVATRLEADLGGFKASIYKVSGGWEYQVERKVIAGQEIVLTNNAETLEECMATVERWSRSIEDLGSRGEIPEQNSGSSS